MPGPLVLPGPAIPPQGMPKTQSGLPIMFGGRLIQTNGLTDECCCGELPACDCSFCNCCYTIGDQMTLHLGGAFAYTGADAEAIEVIGILNTWLAANNYTVNLTFTANTPNVNACYDYVETGPLYAIFDKEFTGTSTTQSPNDEVFLGLGGGAGFSGGRIPDCDGNRFQLIFGNTLRAFRVYPTDSTLNCCTGWGTGENLSVLGIDVGTANWPNPELITLPDIWWENKTVCCKSSSCLPSGNQQCDGRCPGPKCLYKWEAYMGITDGCPTGWQEIGPTGELYSLVSIEGCETDCTEVGMAVDRTVTVEGCDYDVYVGYTCGANCSAVGDCSESDAYTNFPPTLPD